MHSNMSGAAWLLLLCTIMSSSKQDQQDPAVAVGA
jgi:hypothetical protein